MGFLLLFLNIESGPAVPSFFFSCKNFILIFASFSEKNFIVIKKSSLYFYPDKFNSRVDKNEYLKAYNIIQNFNSNGDFGYEKFAENDHFFIWRKKR